MKHWLDSFVYSIIMFKVYHLLLPEFAINLLPSLGCWAKRGPAPRVGEGGGGGFVGSRGAGLGYLNNGNTLSLFLTGILI